MFKYKICDPDAKLDQRNGASLTCGAAANKDLVDIMAKPNGVSQCCSSNPQCTLSRLHTSSANDDQYNG